MPRSLLQYLVECLIAYPVAVVAAFLWGLALNLLPSALLNVPLIRQVGNFLWTPVLAGFWITAAVAAAIAAWCARRNRQNLLRATRAGEWVWVVGAVYIVLGFFTYLPIGHHWVRTALYELFASTDDIGNLATAPFYMGIAYSLTRHFLRVHAEKRAAQDGLQEGRAR
jgi:hypothetical protein